MGIAPINITQRTDVMEPAASGFLPGINGLHIGIIKKIVDDPQSEFRIQVSIPLLNISDNTVWARLSQFSASNKSGCHFIPSVNDEVILGFINNDPSQAIILGSLYSAKNNPCYKEDEKNSKRAIVTPICSKIEFDDAEKYIEFKTPDDHSIL